MGSLGYFRRSNKANLTAAAGESDKALAKRDYTMGTGQVLKWWLYVNITKFTPARAKGKRPRMSSGPSMPPPSALPVKRLRMEGTGSSFGHSTASLVVSSFVRRSALARPPASKATSVKLLFSTIVMDAQGSAVEAQICDVVFASGLTKKVYKTDIDDSIFAAKCSYKVEHRSDDVMTVQNHDAIQSEVEHIVRGKGILSKFYEHCASRNVDVDTSFCFTSVRFTKEVSTAFGFSTASCVPHVSAASLQEEEGLEGGNDDCSDNTHGAYWLIELAMEQLIK
ncbi:hypothetical protein PENSPDRAFT_695181 [Peniophora sp. CONT]|nr:hypothetical protein PENSPDRAFT_695181 [Peniophora sp. CONT]